MELTVLGSSGGIGDGLGSTCLKVGDHVLIDAGTGLGKLSFEAMAGIRHVFLTHSHLDHIASLPLLVMSIMDVSKQPVTVYGLSHTLETLGQHIFNWSVWPDFRVLPSEQAPMLRFVEIETGSRIEVDGVVMEALPAAHTIPAVGYLVSTDNGSMAFTGDTERCEGLWKRLETESQLRGVIVDAAFPNENASIAALSKHYCPQTLAHDVAGFPHSIPLYITHLKSGVESLIMRQCEEALAGRDVRRLVDGMVLAL